MIHMEMARLNPKSLDKVQHIEKQFQNITDFLLDYNMLKTYPYTMINVRMYNPKEEPELRDRCDRILTNADFRERH